MSKKTSVTESLANKHPMKWRGPANLSCMTVRGSVNQASVVLELRGASGADDMLGRAELAPEFAEAVTAFEGSAAYGRLRDLRQRLRELDAAVEELDPRIAELRELFESGRDHDDELEHALGDQRKLEGRRKSLEGAAAKAYRNARLEFEQAMAGVVSRICCDARAARELAIDRLGPAAANALTLLLVARCRENAAGYTPNCEAVIGPAPESATAVAAPPDFAEYDAITPGVFRRVGAA